VLLAVSDRKPAVISQIKLVDGVVFIPDYAVFGRSRQAHLSFDGEATP
jgi:hypothetical protein